MTQALLVVGIPVKGRALVVEERTFLPRLTRGASALARGVKGGGGSRSRSLVCFNRSRGCGDEASMPLNKN